MNASIRSRPQHLGAVRSCFEDIEVVSVRIDPLSEQEAERAIQRFEESFRLNQGSLYCRVHCNRGFREIVGFGYWMAPFIKTHLNTTDGELRRAWQMVLSRVSN